MASPEPVLWSAASDGLCVGDVVGEVEVAALKEVVDEVVDEAVSAAVTLKYQEVKPFGLDPV
jgi:hypothetical protein